VVTQAFVEEARMTPSDFKNSLTGGAPPAGLTDPLKALWWAGKGDWDKAHKICMGDDGADAAWVHAYLHRVEGDLPNARYWYGQAKRKAADGALDAEWAAISADLLVNNGA
jgi:hypothetical protein